MGAAVGAAAGGQIYRRCWRKKVAKPPDPSWEGAAVVFCEVRVERGEAAGFWFQGEKEMTGGYLEKKKMVSSGLRSKIETGGGGWFNGAAC